MSKILDKIIRQVIIEATGETLINMTNSETETLNTRISKASNKIISLVSGYGVVFEITSNKILTFDQIKNEVATYEKGKSSQYNKPEYAYIIGTNIIRKDLFHLKRIFKKYHAFIVILKRDVNTTIFSTSAVSKGTVFDGSAPESAAQIYNAAALPADITLPTDLQKILNPTEQQKKEDKLINQIINVFDDNKTDDKKTDNGSVTANTNKQEVGPSDFKNVNIDGSSIKKQTFTFGQKDNVDLKIFQDELKTQLKADPNNEKLTPNMKAFIATDKMTGYYGPLTSRLIVDLKIIFNYTNKEGKILEPDFQKTLIDKMQSKIKLTEQFNFTDDQLKLITNAPVLLDPVKVDIKKDDIKKDDIKKDDIIKGDTKKVALTKAYQLCLDAAKDLRKITTTNPHDYWSKYLRWNGASYRSNANENGIAWFKSAWNKAWGTKLAAASKIRNTATQKNINELNRRKNDIIEMIRKGGSMTVYLRIQNPSTGAPTDFKIKWDYFAGIQNAAVKGNPKKTVTNKQAQDFYNKKGKYRKPIKNPGFAD